MKKYFFLIQLIIVFALLIVDINLSAQEYSAETRKRIQDVENKLISRQATSDTTRWSLSERMDHYKVPAVSIAVIENYKIDWVKSYGWADKENKIPATTQTLFQAASISKSINAIGILNWVKANDIDLHADINTYLNSWQFKYGKKANGKKISLANLLSHTAGLSYDGFFGYEPWQPLPTIEQILMGKKPANSKKVKSICEPDKQFNYSGGGTLISQLMLSENIGIPYDNYMKEKVLNILGMTNSFFTQPPPENVPLATSHWMSGTPLEGEFHIYPELAAAGLWTNPTDLGHFIIEIQKSLLGRSNLLLSQEATKEMLTPYLKDEIPGLGYTCFGFFITKINGKSYFSHGGNVEGSNCYYFGSMEDGKGLVIMTNSENFNIIPEIIQSVGKVYKW